MRDRSIDIIRAVAELDAILDHLVGPGAYRIEGAWDDAPRLTVTGVPAGPRVAGDGPQIAYDSDRRLVATLAARTTELRAGRFDGDATAPLDEGWAHALVEDNDRWFLSGIWVGSGWADLLHAARAMLREIPHADLRTTDLKEKLGSLRWHVHVPDSARVAMGAAGVERLHAILSAVEIVSWAVCEDCGAPGRLRTDRDWMRSLCDEHAQEGEE